MVADITKLVNVERAKLPMQLNFHYNILNASFPIHPEFTHSYYHHIHHYACHKHMLHVQIE